jgi:hypothetical protein
VKLYLLSDDTGLYLAEGEDCVKAAESVIAKIGGNMDVNRFSVQDADVMRDGAFCIRYRWWMFFTRDPECRGRIL